PARRIVSPSETARVSRRASAESWPLKKSTQTEVSTSIGPPDVTRCAQGREIPVPGNLAAHFQELPTLQRPRELCESRVDRSLLGGEAAQAHHLLEEGVV